MSHYTSRLLSITFHSTVSTLVHTSAGALDTNVQRVLVVMSRQLTRFPMTHAVHRSQLHFKSTYTSPHFSPCAFTSLIDHSISSSSSTTLFASSSLPRYDPHSSSA
eukprot:182166-Amphidinium_carterae.3